MKTIEIIGANAGSSWTKARTTCRGILLKGSKMLLSYEQRTDMYMIPGGGLEGQESKAECCYREIAEETGVTVSVGEQFLTVYEFYEDWRYESAFFLCRPLGKTARKLTANEVNKGLVPRWVDVDEALAIFSRHREYAETDEEKRGIYLREYMALREFINRKSSVNPPEIH